jgi:energy-coupling factor transporter ATP-binding protein EcfA2
MAVPIFVDFDDTLTTGEGEVWWKDALDETPRWEMIELVNNLYKQGHTIIIYTARREEVREETQYYLNKWDVMHHALKMEKPGYRLLIDDRAVSDESALEMGAEEIRSTIYNNES